MAPAAYKRERRRVHWRRSRKRHGHGQRRGAFSLVRVAHSSVFGSVYIARYVESLFLSLHCSATILLVLLFGFLPPGSYAYRFSRPFGAPLSLRLFIRLRRRRRRRRRRWPHTLSALSPLPPSSSNKSSTYLSSSNRTRTYYVLPSSTTFSPSPSSPAQEEEEEPRSTPPAPPLHHHHTFPPSLPVSERRSTHREDGRRRKEEEEDVNTHLKNKFSKRVHSPRLG